MQYIVFNKYDNVIYCNVLGTKCSIFSLREWNKEMKKKKDFSLCCFFRAI